jgi:site-specific DNA-methyltransferase (adenine-specific)
MVDKTQCFNRDCLSAMREFPDKYFELAIVDPPYGIGTFTISHTTQSDGRRTKNKKTYDDGYLWNESIPHDEYFQELQRVSKDQIIWGANYYNCFNADGGSIVWYKGDATETLSRCEIASVSSQKKVSFIHINWQSGFYRTAKEGIQIHPCQKPVALYKWLLKNYAKEGDKILDTHLGSGSSRIAAFDMGFEFWGYELDQEYFEASCKRFNQHKAQLTLF